MGNNIFLALDRHGVKEYPPMAVKSVKEFLERQPKPAEGKLTVGIYAEMIPRGEKYEKLCDDFSRSAIDREAFMKGLDMKHMWGPGEEAYGKAFEELRGMGCSIHPGDVDVEAREELGHSFWKIDTSYWENHSEELANQQLKVLLGKLSGEREENLANNALNSKEDISVIFTHPGHAGNIQKMLASKPEITVSMQSIPEADASYGKVEDDIAIAAAMSWSTRAVVPRIVAGFNYKDERLVPNPKIAEMNLDFSKAEERPYGWKIQLTSHSQVLGILPGHSTVLAAKLGDLNTENLRSHAGASFERVTVLGYESGTQDDKPVVLYTYMNKYGTEKFPSQTFSRGASYDSVRMDKAVTGYWHDNRNISDKPILVLIEWGDLTYGQEIADLNVRYEQLEADVYKSWLEEWGWCLRPEAAKRIKELDAEYAKQLEALDEEQKKKLSVEGRGMDDAEITKHFEELITKASAEHAQKVMDVAGTGYLDPPKPDVYDAFNINNISASQFRLVELKGARFMLLDSYQKDCIDYFNPKDGMLSRYYAEVNAIRRRYGKPEIATED
jgi:hypothetical protein